MTDRPDTLRQRIAAAAAQAIRTAAHHCDGKCGKPEQQCMDEHPVQVTCWTFDVVSDVDGPVDDLARVAADAVLAEVQPELDKAQQRGDIWKDKAVEMEKDRDRLAAELEQAQEQLRTVQVGALTREIALEDARDTLEAAGQCGAHGDDWPNIGPSLDALVAERDRLAAAVQALTEAVILWRDRPGGDIGLAIALSSILDAEQPDPPAATAMVRVLRECDRLEREARGQHDDGLREAVRRIRTALDGPAAPSEPTPCSQPDPCKGGEPCDTHATERAHADGDHEWCDVTCEASMRSDQMRNFIIAKGYPGTAGALDELLRRAAAGTSRPAAPATEETL